MRDDIKKRREKYKIKSIAQRIFGGKELIVERKSGMTFAEYSFMRKMQSRAMKMLFKQPSDRYLQTAMRSQAHPYLEMEVIKRRAIKQGRLEEIKPVEHWTTNIFSKIFNFLRNAWGQNNVRTSF